MEEKKNNTWLIVLLILVILGLVGYIVYDKVLSNESKTKCTEVDEEKQNDNNNDETPEQTTSLPEWANYLLEQNITKITVKRGVTEGGLDPEVGCLEDKQITNEELKQVLEKMTKGKLTKHLDAGGFGGPCLTDIIIEYNNDKELELFLNKYIVTKDKKIKSLLELEDYVEDNVRNSTIDGDPNTLFEYEWDDSFIETLFE